MSNQPIIFQDKFIKQLELDALLDLSNAISRQQDEKSLLKIYLFTLMANFKIERMLMFENTNKKWIQILKHGLEHNYSPHTEELTQVLESQFSIDFKENEMRTLNEKFDFSIPIIKDNEIVVCILIGGLHRISVSKETIKFIQTISNILFVAILNARLNQKRIEQEVMNMELSMARKLQLQLFPEKLPNSDFLKINATYCPHQSVGGDYYDYIPIANGEFMVCIADVSGKGIVAAFIMSNVQAALRVLSKQGLKMEQIVVELNALVHKNTKGEKFVTFFIAKYIPRKNMLVYVNCGHNPPLLMAEDKSIISLQQGTVMLGAFEHLPFINTGKVYGINKSVLFAYTDGLTESVELTDTDVALNKVSQIMKSDVPFNDFHNAILSSLAIGQQAVDDITLLSCFYQLTNDLID